MGFLHIIKSPPKVIEMVERITKADGMDRLMMHGKDG